jgi:ATP-binding protein involved in chromosome partitioning
LSARVPDIYEAPAFHTSFCLRGSPEGPIFDQEQLKSAVAGVADPAGGGSVLASGRLSALRWANGAISGVLALDGLSGAAGEKLRADVERALSALPGSPAARLILTAERGTGSAAASRGATGTEPKRPRDIGAIVAVASGKGGVGKSTVAVNLAVALAGERRRRVGIVDGDIYGPSVPTLLGLSGRAGAENQRIKPMERYGIKALSMGLLTDPDQAVVWRGPMAASAFTQLVEQADWGPLDVLVIDLPPGTGDIQLTMAQKVRPDGAVIVSTPQDLALVDARRAIAMFGKVNVPVLGLIENMSYFTCPHCGGRSDIFGHGGAEETSVSLGVPFLGAVPLLPQIRADSDAGRPPAASADGHGDAFRNIAREVARRLGI